jgi:8-oxo-dGTP pyrophosphatase MutT (NUDIX family)
MFEEINTITKITLTILIAYNIYVYNKNKKYVPSKKWFAWLLDKGKYKYVDIIPKFTHLESHMESLIKAPKFLKWLKKMNSEQITLVSVTVSDIDWFAAIPNPEKLGFVKCAGEAYDYLTGKKIVSNISFIRGDSVGILILVKVLGDSLKRDKEYILLCEQHRLPIGQKAKEIAAGMMDAEGNIISVALKEIKEETGFNVKHSDELIDLGSYFASPGGCDERIHLFAWTTAISYVEFEEKKSRMFGCAKENEEIKLSFVELEEFKSTIMYEIGDAKAEIALTRYLSGNFV